MDNSIRARVARLLKRHRFAVLGYSAEDETYCPQCLRLSTGLSPHGIDTNGKPVLPLHACDPSFHEEVCISCHQPLVDLVPGLQPTLTFKVFRRVTEPDSTIVRQLPAGTLVLHGDGRGVLYADAIGEKYEIFPGESHATEVVETVTARPPIVHHKRVALA
jgi:hypothetical protein